MSKGWPLFYGWIIVLITVIAMALVYGTRHSFSVFFPPILDEFGWNRGSTALMLSLNLSVYGFTAPLAGYICDRWKPQWVMPIGISMLGIVTATCAYAQELWHFYLFFGILMPIAIAFSGWPVLGPALAHWFVKRRGLVMGIGQMGGGFSFTYGFFIERIIAALDWRSAFFVIAGILIAVLLPLYTFFFHHHPRSKGLQSYGASELALIQGMGGQETETATPVPDWTLRKAIGTRQLWLFIISHSLFWGIGCYMVLAHQVKFTLDIGYDGIFAAFILGLYGFFMAVGQPFCAISDRIGREVTVTISVMLAIGALVALLSVEDTTQSFLLYIYAICMGLGTGLFIPAMYAGVADVFHGRRYGIISGLPLTGMGLGGAIGPWLGGYIYDLSGSYTGAVMGSIGCFALSCVAYWLAAPRKALKIREHLLYN